MQQYKNKHNSKKPSFWRQFSLPAIIILLALSPAPVMAQSGEGEAKVEQQLNSISRQLRALQERVLDHFSGHGQSANAGNGGEVSQGGERALLADMEVRLGAIDREFRNLTGQIEEMGYRQRQLQTQFENFRADMELRFQDLSAAPLEPVAEAEESIVEDYQQQQEAPSEATIVAENSQDGDVAVDSLEPIAEELAPIVLTPKPPEESYEQAFGFLRRGDYQGAENAFIEFLGNYASHELAGNAQYWLAETYYARRDYTNAAAAFLKGYQEYSEGAKAPDSLLKLGMSLAAMGQVAEACLAFDDIAVRYSDATQNLLNSAKREAERNSCD